MTTVGAPPADQDKKPVPVTGHGITVKSGRTDEPTNTPRVDRRTAESIARRYGPLSTILMEDFDAEIKAVQKARDYKKFKPLVLLIDDSAKKVLEGLGYKPKEKSKTGHAVFDIFDFDLAKVLSGVTILIAGLYAKPKIRDRFLERYRDWLNGRMDPSQVKIPDAKSKERARKAFEANVDAYVNVVVSLMKILIAVWPWVKESWFDEEEHKKEEQERSALEGGGRPVGEHRPAPLRGALRPDRCGHLPLHEPQ
ncbi:hypothetical protein ACFL59_02685 [Planctomycetota bacterium]